MYPEDEGDSFCTGCIFNDGHDRISSEGFCIRPSKIDEMYCGEYSKSRERKNTRTINSDMKNVPSDSECDASCVVRDSDYFNNKQRGDHGDNQAKRTKCNAVDVTDRQEISPPERSHFKSIKPLDECQACCYNDSEHHYKNAHRHKQDKYYRNVEAYSSSRLHATCKAGNRNKKMRNVHFNTKYIRSDPCTCTMNLLSNANHETRMPRGNHFETNTPTKRESKALKAKRCVCECNIRKKSFSKKSIQMVKHANDRIRYSIKSSISKLENKFRIKKDSRMVFRDKLRHTNALKKYECEPDYCVPKECLPLKCNERLKAKFGSLKRISQLSIKSIKRKKKQKSNHVCICEPEPEAQPKSSSYYNKIKCGLGCIRKSVNNMVRKSIHDISRVASDLQSKSKEMFKLNHVCMCEPEPEFQDHHRYDIKSRFGSIKRSFHEIGKVASDVSLKVANKIESKRKEKSYDRHSNKKIGLNIYIEPSRVAKKSTKKAHRTICQCDRTKKKQKRVSVEIETEPVIDEKEFKKYKKDNSAGSFATRKSLLNQFEQPSIDKVKKDDHPTKQVVRIGSSFSFNVEFYKESDKDTKVNVKMHDIGRKSLHSKTGFSQKSHRNRSVKSNKKQLCDSSTCHGLKRCACTLALRDQSNKKKNTALTQEKSSLANFKANKNKVNKCECDTQQIKTKQTKSKKKTMSHKSYSFARDSFFDSIEKCDPVICERRVHKSLGTTSPISIAKASMKSQCGDEYPNKQRDTINSTNESRELPEIPRETEKTLSRNVVRIGSSFSFDIQFYKEHEPDYVDVPLKMRNKSLESVHRQRRSIRENRKVSSTHKACDSRFDLADSDFKNKCPNSCGGWISTFSRSKSQTNSIITSIDKATKTKPIKKDPKNICKCDITRKTQTSPLSPPYCTLKVCDPLCKLRDLHTLKHVSKSKKVSTDRPKAASYNTTGSTTDASSSKRQLLKQRRKKIHRDYDSIHNAHDGSLHRQATRIGSNLSFNIEFYKDRISEKQSELSNNKSITERDKKKCNTAKYNSYHPNIKCNNLTQRCLQKGTQINKIHDAPKESLIKPFIDKCLCTLKRLKLRKDKLRKLEQPKENVKDLKSQKCQCAIRKSANHSLYQSRDTVTDKKDLKSLSSGTSKSYIKCRKLQLHELGSNHRHTPKKDFYTTDNEEPIAMSNKQLVRISSSFSFNLEFYKERGDFKQEDKPKQIKDPRRIGKRDRNEKCKSQNLHKRNCNKNTSTHIQIKERDIPEEPNSILKRCFCTLKKIKIHNDSQKPKTKNKSITAKESKKAHNKRILAICECEKCIDTKSLKQLRKESFANAEPIRMKSVTCCTDSKPIRSKSQKIQFELSKRANYKIKNNTKDLSTLSVITPAKKSVIISSSFNFDVVFSKEIGKSLSTKPHKQSISKPQTLDNSMFRERRNMGAGRKERTANLGSMLKHCWCQQKTQSNNEKTFQIANKDVSMIKKPYLCEKSVRVKKKQGKVQSVLDVKNPCVRAKTVKSNLREVSTKIHSDQSIKREIPKQKHRLHKNPTIKVCSPNNKVDEEFFKQFGCLEDCGSINYKKLKKDQRETHLNYGPKGNMSKKINDRKLGGSVCPRHREYQVGYMKNEVDKTSLKPQFQQEFNVCYVEIPTKTCEPLFIVNPAIMEENPYGYKSIKSNLRNKGMKKGRGKKRVSFQGNIDKKIQTKTGMKHKYISTNNINQGALTRFKQGKLAHRFSRKYDFRKKKINHIPSTSVESEFNPGRINEKGCNECCKTLRGRPKKRKKAKKISDKLKMSQEPNKHNYIPTKYQNKDMALDIEIIKPYSKRNFNKKVSRNCLKDKCAVKVLGDKLRDNKLSKTILRPNKTYYGLLFAKKTLAKIQKSFYRSANTCVDICMAQGKTNLAKSVTTPEMRKFNEPNNTEPELNPIETDQKKSITFRRKVRMKGIKLKKYPARIKKKSVVQIGTSTEETKKLEGDKKLKQNEDSIEAKVAKGIKKLKFKQDKGSIETKVPKGVKKIKFKQNKGFEETKVPKGVMKFKLKQDKHAKKIQPCKCGSTICKTIPKGISQKIGLKRKKGKKKEVVNALPPCTCGNRICEKKSKSETKKIYKRIKYNICECKPEERFCECFEVLQAEKVRKNLKEKKAKEKKKKEIELRELRAQKMKKFQEEFCSTFKKAIQERQEQKQEKIYKQSSDKVLVAESILDLAKIGADVVWNMLKGTYKVATKPKKSYADFKKTVSDPSALKKQYSRSRFPTIINRLKRRFAAMQTTRDVKECMEKNTIANYIIHSMDKDPSKRLKKKKKMRRTRERTDFECSAYMASLRKRPHLWFYDRCPSLYPQFISMLTVWKQFLDIVCFLLAVFVWSPCILSIEICRALMCCCLCTG